MPVLQMFRLSEMRSVKLTLTPQEFDMAADVFWNNLAEKYARKPVDDPDAFERKIALIKSMMTPEDVILDVGCGTGSLALRLASDGAQIHGLDLSREMIRIANEKAAAQKVDNVTFHTAPFDDNLTAFEPESLDGICACSLLHLVEDRPAVLAHIHRLLKPGGFFISSTLCLGESKAPFWIVLTLMRWLGKAPVVKTFSKKTFGEEVARAGFVELSTPDVGAKPTIEFMIAKKPK